MSSEFSLVTTTCSDLAQAETIAQALVAAQLAACVQIMPISSYYTWQGQVEHAQEHLLLIKSKTKDWEKLALELRRMHTAQVPQITRIDIAQADAAYSDWLRAVTRPSF